MTPHPGPEDLTYLRTFFVPLERLCAVYGYDLAAVDAAIEDELLPRPVYTLADGTRLVAPDHFELAHLAGGFDALPRWFVQAFDAYASTISRDVGSGQEQLPHYLGGGYAACLRTVTPANMITKAVLIDTIDDLVALPDPDDHAWRDELTRRVDALDGLLRPFAVFDRIAYGPTSRDRCVDEVRGRFSLTMPPVPGF